MYWIVPALGPDLCAVGDIWITVWCSLLWTRFTFFLFSQCFFFYFAESMKCWNPGDLCHLGFATIKPAVYLFFAKIDEPFGGFLCIPRSFVTVQSIAKGPIARDAKAAGCLKGSHNLKATQCLGRWKGSWQCQSALLDNSAGGSQSDRLASTFPMWLWLHWNLDHTLLGHENPPRYWGRWAWAPPSTSPAPLPRSRIPERMVEIVRDGMGHKNKGPVRRTGG